MQDQEIIELYWHRDEKAVAESGQKYGAYCFVIANHILSNKEDADECVNDTWLAAWNSIPPQRPNRFSAFLGRITRNVSLNKFKSKYAGKRGGGELPAALDELGECIPGEDSADGAVNDAELQKCISRFLGGLPERERNIFLRRYWYVEPLAAIAERYGMKQNSVKGSLFRSREKLRKCLEKEDLMR